MNIPLVRAPKDDASDFDTAAWRDTTFDLQSIVDMVRRRWRLMAAVWFAVTALGVAIALIAPAKYQAVALVLLGSGQERVLSPEQMVTGGPNASVGAAVESEMEVLRSPALLGRVVDALELSTDPDWSAGSGNVAARRNAAIAALGRAVTVRRRGLSYSIEVAVRSGSPARAAELANMIADLYLQDQLEVRSASAARAHAWLSQRLGELREELATKEAEIEAFRQQSGLVAAEGSSLAEQQTTESLAAVLAARADVAAKEAQYAQAERVIASGASAGSMAGAINSEVIRELRAREADIARRQADLEGRYTGEHPALINIRAEREDIALQINAEIARLTESLRNEVEISRARLGTLERSLGSSRHELNTNNQALLRLRELEREAAATRGVYENFLQRDNEIDDQGSMQSTNARILARAFPPSGRDWGELGIGILMACGVGFLLGFATGSGAEALDDTMHSPEDVQRKARLATLALVPHLRGSAWRSLLGIESSRAICDGEAKLGVHGIGARAARRPDVLAARREDRGARDQFAAAERGQDDRCREPRACGGALRTPRPSHRLRPAQAQHQRRPEHQADERFGASGDRRGGLARDVAP